MSSWLKKRRASRWMSWVAAAVVVLAGGCSRAKFRQLRADDSFIKVMTYNLNVDRPVRSSTLRAIARPEADIVLLQETSPKWEDALAGRFGDEYPYMAFRHCCHAGGLGILSKYPIVEDEYIPTRHGWYPAWRFIVLTEVGPVQVLNVHLRPPTHPRGGLALATTPAIRRKEIEQYFPALRRDLPTIIAGDFNEGPLGRAIGYLRDRGFRSALREFRTPQFTWRWDTGLPDVKVQLDHIVYGGGLVPLQTYVIMAGESDHFPVIGVFARRGRIASTATRVSQL